MPPIAKKKLTKTALCKILTLHFSLGLLFMNFSFGQKALRDSLKNELGSLKPLLQSTLQDSSYVNILNDLAMAMRFYKSDSLLTLAKEAFDQSKSIGYANGEIMAQIGIGDYYSDQGIHEEGIYNYRRALEAAQNLNKDDLLLNAENRLAGEYEYQGDYAMSLQEMLKGIEIATRLKNKEMLSVFNENIALLYHKQKDYEEALNYLTVSKRFNQEINDDVFSAYTFANMASVYADAHQYEYAIFNVNKSIAIFEEHDVMDWLAFGYETKGKTY